MMGIFVNPEQVNMCLVCTVAVAVAVAFVDLICSSYLFKNRNDEKYTILPTVPVTMVSELCTAGVVVVVVVIIAIPISIAIADCIVATAIFVVSLTFYLIIHCTYCSRVLFCCHFTV